MHRILLFSTCAVLCFTACGDRASYDSAATHPVRTSNARVGQGKKWSSHAGMSAVAHRDHSSIAIDIDSASMGLLRRSLFERGELPAPASVRVEELINAFDYRQAHKGLADGHPFGFRAEVATCPWQPRHQLLRVHVDAPVPPGPRPAAQLVLLIDDSGSMRGSRLQLIREAAAMLCSRLEHDDRVSVITFGGGVDCLLRACPGDQGERISRAFAHMHARGSTSGADGLREAYDLAVQDFDPEASNRVLLFTDGAFNVGARQADDLLELIHKRARGRIFLSVLGCGDDVRDDQRLEELSNHGDGSYAHLDSLAGARRFLLDAIDAHLQPVAQDMKIQVFFNPRRVRSWRLLGYDNRRIAARDFNDDLADGGELGAGQGFSLLYELESTEAPMVDRNPFAGEPERADGEGELQPYWMRLRIRYRRPLAAASELLEYDVPDRCQRFAAASADFRWCASVAAAGSLLRRAPLGHRLRWWQVIDWAQSAAVGSRQQGREREQFLRMLGIAERLDAGGYAFGGRKRW